MEETTNFFAIAAGSITGCTTIDHTTTDNGFLNCARASNPGSGSHGSTIDAVNNLLNCIGARKIQTNIIGHGNDGLIVTGTGQITNDPDKYIGLWNQSNWQPKLTLLANRISSLYLWGCHPGTGVNGANFLYNVARVVNSPVSAPTGFLYCGGGKLWLEQGSTWQTATPTHKPNPIPAPTPHLNFALMNTMKIMSNDAFVDLTADNVVSVSVTTALKDIGSLTADDSKSLLALIDFSQPITIPGIPAAISTGSIKATFDNNGRKINKEFIIYNNRLIVDAEALNTAYRCSEGISNFLI